MSDLSFENTQVNKSIKTGKVFRVPKTMDQYLEVTFRYPGVIWRGAIPIRTDYQGTNIPLDYEDVCDWIEKCYELLDPGCAQIWTKEQEAFWDERNSDETRLVFEALNDVGKMTEWHCRKCGPVPSVNPQAASRIRAIKQNGFYIASMQKECANCGKKETFDLLIRLPRNASNSKQRSPISRKLKKRILDLLPSVDCVFQESVSSSSCVIDHKFPSSRWVNGESPNRDDMSDEEIIQKFQILSNRSNLQKERYCQQCVIDGVRGTFFGIEWYYEGDRKWDGTSKADEQGCVGCPWYDVERWRRCFNQYLHGGPVDESFLASAGFAPVDLPDEGVS
ncbi:hypothetical protein [Adlercreutzia equolifaciens]|uniref:hypothetical protein n=1 Tax=Adlercreutzia equolifaciens TaxID=446660 RepID=UPI0022E2D4BD|nr:hypothetical protein [Adlercreutzia equolifaciens]